MSDDTKTTASHVQQSAEAARRMFDAQLGRMGEMFGEAGRIEARGVTQLHEGIDETARLAKETVEYWTRLSASWRALAIDSMRKSTEMFGGAGGVAETERASKP